MSVREGRAFSQSEACTAGAGWAPPERPGACVCTPRGLAGGHLVVGGAAGRDPEAPTVLTTANKAREPCSVVKRRHRPTGGRWRSASERG